MNLFSAIYCIGTYINIGEVVGLEPTSATNEIGVLPLHHTS
jgi:hypothetical protein